MPRAILLKRRLNRVIELEKGVRDKRQRLKDQLSDIVHDAELNVAPAESSYQNAETHERVGENPG